MEDGDGMKFGAYVTILPSRAKFHVFSPEKRRSKFYNADDGEAGIVECSLFASRPIHVK